MGDVFDAMNRAKRDRGEDPPPTDRAEVSPAPTDEKWTPTAGTGESEELPALPIEEMRSAHPPASSEDPSYAGSGVEKAAGLANLPPPTSDSGSDASSPSRIDLQPKLDEQKDKETVAELPLVDPSQNGYANEVVVHHDRGGAITEQYRAIRTQILARARNRSLQVHVITSSAPGEGKSVSTVNLGITFSELKNQKTLLIEGDLRRPSFQRLFHRKFNGGMLQLLRGEVTDFDQVIHETVYPNLQFIPAGGHDHLHSTELLTSPRMSQILDRLKDRYDHIFIDSPPVVSVTDAAILGAMADQVLLVVRLYKTPIEVVDRAKRLLRANNCELAGVVLTHMKVHMPKYLYKYGYYYGYNYGYSYGPTKKDS